jgi:hypothetical protein
VSWIILNAEKPAFRLEALMKTQLIPVLMTAVLAATAAQARPNDDDDRQHQRAERPQAAAPQQQQQQQQPQPQPQQRQPEQQPQPQAQAQPRQRERTRSGAQTGQSDAQRAGRVWIPGDPNHPSAPRGNPYAGSQGSQGAAQPAPDAPRAGGNGAQGSGQQAAERSWRGNRPQSPNWQADRGRVQSGNQQRNWRDSQGHDWRANRGWYDRYRVDHYRYDGGRYFARQRYSLGFYAYPRGYSTRLWLAGEWLPPAFFIDGRYDLDNYWVYELYEPPLGCRWTRVGNDALLIDEETGEVLDAVYDLFW